MKKTTLFQQINTTRQCSPWVVATLAVFAGIGQTDAQTWFGTSAPNDVSWVSLASSADGTRLVAAASYPTWSVYTSANSGGTWTETTQNIGFNCLVCSADATKVAGAQSYDGFIYTSTDAGVTFTQTSAPQGSWDFMAGSTNGTTLAAVGYFSGVGQIYVSSDSGVTWSSTAPQTNWNGLACSADGTRLIASIGGNGIFYTSTDSGVTWSPQTNEPNIWWAALASAADGLKVAAVVVGGGIYTSTNGGTNWTQQTNAPVEDWIAITSSADGATLAAAVKSGFGPGAPGPIYTSTDSGATWTSNNLPAEWWSSIVCSTDGSKLAACSAYVETTTNGGVAVDQIVTSTPQLWMSMAIPDTNDVTVLWPWPAENFQLQQKPTPASTNWVAVTNIPVVTNYQSQVTLPLSGQEGCFRLINTNSP